MKDDVKILLTNTESHSSSEMESAAVQPEATDVQSPIHERNDDFDNDEAKRKKPGIRKRTKTGCLTCRKRRIKCDEGRPICNNCTKSKRHCDGYNQRVIFKDPLGAFHGGSYGPVVFPTESPQYSFFSTTALGAQSKPSSQVPPLAFIAPKPPPHLNFQGSFLGTYSPPFSGQPGPSASKLNSSRDDHGNQLELSSPHIVFPTNLGHQERETHSAYIVGPLSDERRINYENEQPLVRQNSDSFLDSARFEPPKEMLQPQQLYSLADGGVDHSDDDLYLVDSEDEFERAQLTNAYGNGAQSHNYNPFAGCSMGTRPFSAWANNNVLTSYVPCAVNSPLNDSKAAGIFWHFVNVTGPSMSLYERHLSQNCSRREFAQSGYNAKHNIWTYTFPVIAFQHPALLQAILAMGSLQIAKLRDEPATSALKHYHLAIRRVAQYVRSHARRTQPATVASTLLLAFFEVWNSDHTKWSQHLYGARLLFKEIPFREMTRSLLPIKRARRSLFEEKLRQSIDPPYLGFTYSQHPENDLDNLDLECLSHLTGQNIRYENDQLPSGMWHTDRDIEQYERLRDLYWWYSKMDVYQGLLSGGRPFMEFEHWTQCPPRAPMGRLDAVYGTYDHLVLVMARLMTFAAKDLPRKRKFAHAHETRGTPPSASTEGVMNVQPRDWHLDPPHGLTAHHRVPPGMPFDMIPGILPGEPLIRMTPGSIVSDVMSHPGLAPGTTSSMMPSGGCPVEMHPDMMQGGPPSDSPLMFPGMLPTTGEVTLPMGFSPPPGASAPGGRHEDVDPEMTTAEAMREWESIRAAFELLRANFGSKFNPIYRDYEEEDRQKSPFGSTLRYRTFSVAGIWLNYYMGLIHLYRAHPKMPPAAMIAQGIQARHTWQYALEIGRISAGLAGDLSNATEISTLMGAALVECALPLFVGAIQYQENHQRHWVIKRLHDVARLTGWQSARQIADGCETAWIKAAELGKGPLYVRDPMLEREMPRSLWAMPRKIHSELEQLDSSDKVLVVARSDRAAYALGLLTAQHELDRLQLEDG